MQIKMGFVLIAKMRGRFVTLAEQLHRGHQLIRVVRELPVGDVEDVVEGPPGVRRDGDLRCRVDWGDIELRGCSPDTTLVADAPPDPVVAVEVVDVRDTVGVHGRDGDGRFERRIVDGLDQRVWGGEC